jgi:hypothetical protein
MTAQDKSRIGDLERALLPFAFLERPESFNGAADDTVTPALLLDADVQRARAMFGKADLPADPVLREARNVLRMVREAVEEFDPVAALESEEATLLRGPALADEAMAIVDALGRVRQEMERLRSAGGAGGLVDATTRAMR